MIELLAAYGFSCCDLPWHDRVGKKYAGPYPPTEARALGEWLVPW